MNPTTTNELESALTELTANKTAWAQRDLSSRIELLSETRGTTIDAAEAWVEAACALKSVDADSPVAGEEWLGGPMVFLRNLRLLERTLREIDTKGGVTTKPRHVNVRPDGQVTVRVFPSETADAILYSGFRADVWQQPGVTRETLASNVAERYRATSTGDAGRVCVVLGAGNVTSIGPMDVIHKLFVEHQVCVLKMHPVNESAGPHLEKALAPLVRAGLLRFVYGGAEIGAQLVAHSAVDTNPRHGRQGNPRPHPRCDAGRARRTWGQR